MQKKGWKDIKCGDVIVRDSERIEVLEVGASGKTFMIREASGAGGVWKIIENLGHRWHLEGEEPKLVLMDGDLHYIADPLISEGFFEMRWEGKPNNIHQEKHGLVFPYTEEGRLAAIAKSKKMLGIEE